MDDTGTRAARSSRRRRWFGAGGLLGVGILAGAILAGTQIASAAGSSSNGSGAGSTGAPAAYAPNRPDPATMGHGPGETLLTGSKASTVTAAAKAAVPGATVIRVETDSNGGAVYEAHMQKADGTFVTVKFDKSFTVTGTDAGFGGPGAPSSH
jgi:hypothetical protein